MSISWWAIVDDTFILVSSWQLNCCKLVKNMLTKISNYHNSDFREVQIPVSVSTSIHKIFVCGLMTMMTTDDIRTLKIFRLISKQLTQRHTYRCYENVYKLSIRCKYSFYTIRTQYTWKQYIGWSDVTVIYGHVRSPSCRVWCRNLRS